MKIITELSMCDRHKVLYLKDIYCKPFKVNEVVHKMCFSKAEIPTFNYGTIRCIYVLVAVHVQTVSLIE